MKNQQLSGINEHRPVRCRCSFNITIPVANAIFEHLMKSINWKLLLSTVADGCWAVAGCCCVNEWLLILMKRIISNAGNDLQSH